MGGIYESKSKECRNRKAIMKKMFLLGLCGVSFIASIGYAKIEIHGHRGARGSRPENTLPAFSFALESGVDTLELDLGVSSDGELVISHEPAITPERCLDPARKKMSSAILIKNLKYEEIKKYDCGTLGNEKFPKQVAVPHTPMPRLEDLFIMIEKSNLPGAKDIRFNVETKIFPARPDLTPDPLSFAKKVIELSRKHNMIGRVILQSFDDRTLLAAKRIEPKLMTALLTSENHLDFVAAAKSAKADILSPNLAWILPEDVEKLHKVGVKVIPWTANQPGEWDLLIAAQVDGIITDYPKELVEYMKVKKLQ